MTNSMTVDIPEATMQVPVDVEHAGVRLGVPLLAVLTFVVSLWGWPQLFEAVGQRDSWLGLLALPLALVTTIVIAFIGDRFIKRTWSSGRVLALQEDRLELRNSRRQNAVIRWDAHINVLYWRFAVPRRGRVPKGFLCLAVQLLQDEELVTLYAFVDPKKTDSIPDFDLFVPLAARTTVKDERVSMRVAGQQRRLLQAEDERWRNGAELTADDFQAVWPVLQYRLQAYQE